MSRRRAGPHGDAARGADGPSTVPVPDMDGTSASPPGSMPAMNAQRFFELSGTLLAVAAFDGTIRWTSSSFPRKLGFPPEELLGESFLDFVHPGDLEPVLRELDRVRRGEEVVAFEWRMRSFDGSYRSMLWSAIGVPEEELIYGSAQDVTELREAERRFETAFDSAPLATLLVSAREEDIGSVKEVNAAASRFFARSEAELLGTRLQDLLYAEDLQVVVDEGERLLTGEIESYQFEARFLAAGGEVRWGKQSVSLIRDAAGEPALCVVQIVDIGERKRVEEVVRRSRERLQAIVDGMPALVSVTDLDGRFEVVNTALAEQMGMHPREIVGRRREELLAAEVLEPFIPLTREAFRSEAPVTDEVEVEWRGEQRIYLTHAFALRDADGHAYAFAVTATDITARVRADEERRRLEARSQHAQRLESIGRLAGGIAHDFNNLLSVILNNASLASDALPEGSQGRADLAEVVAAAERAAELTHQLVIFSRQQVAEPEVLDPNAVITRAKRLLSRTIGEDVELRIELAPDVSHVEIDPGQLDRVILNLAMNARDAMPEGGLLEIASRHVELADGPGVRLAVRDHGEGMTAEVVERAFEPFFSTKSQSGGTGLGLATVYGIVTQAGGRVELASDPGEGTTVTVTLPAATSAPVPPPAGASSDDAGAGAGERVLVAEDDESVRRLAVRLLSEAGYEVLEACDLEEGVGAGADGRRIDLLIADVVMPEASGRALAERLSAAQDGLRVLYMSGYSEDVLARHGVDPERVAFLPKPFTRDSLLRAVRGSLEQRAPAAS